MFGQDDEELYECPYCGAIFNYQDEFELHLDFEESKLEKDGE